MERGRVYRFCRFVLLSCLTWGRICAEYVRFRRIYVVVHTWVRRAMRNASYGNVLRKARRRMCVRAWKNCIVWKRAAYGTASCVCVGAWGTATCVCIRAWEPCVV